MNVSDDGADLWIEMCPPVGHKGQLAPSTKLESRGQLDGGTLSFRTSVTNHDELEGKLYYRLSGLRILTYQQRRSAASTKKSRVRVSSRPRGKSAGGHAERHFCWRADSKAQRIERCESQTRYYPVELYYSTFGICCGSKCDTDTPPAPALQSTGIRVRYSILVATAAPPRKIGVVRG